ncbi:VanZ family protein [Amycolatopsis keratiniphila]|uniref:VanZ family protein n=1 Tax=Amycolatopsis keratiniphila TaxID=129921 RepID=UPI0009077922|nr:VanZ family protein [Amycolatopsis keratiniphila]OLZ60705.1 hypothetical protein BS330_03515 [Amycolatopsis keratiniphila subsp. nogabecina]
MVTIPGTAWSISPWTAVAVALGVLVSILVAPRIASRAGWHRNTVLTTLLLLACSLALTLSPVGAEPHRGEFHPCLASNGTNYVHGTPHSSGNSGEVLFNVLVLLPVACSVVLTTKRVLAPAIFAFLLPVIIESAQTLVPGRHCSASGLTGMTAGALLGVALGYLLLHRAGKRGPRGRGRTQLRPLT